MDRERVRQGIEIREVEDVEDEFRQTDSYSKIDIEIITSQYERNSA